MYLLILLPHSSCKSECLQVFMRLIKNQFMEPVPGKVTTKAQSKSQLNVRKRSSELSNLKRPSDYRRIAMKIQKEKQKAAQRFLSNDGEEEPSVVSEELTSEEDIANTCPIKFELISVIETMIDTIDW